MRRVRATAALLVLLLCGCTAPEPAESPTAGESDPTAGATSASGPQFPFVDAGPDGVRIVDGEDWSLPDTTVPAHNAGLFSEEASPEDLVDVHSVDATWRQLQPSAGSPIDRETSGSAQDMHLDGLAAQLAEPGEFWMRLFASGEDWAPEWVAVECGVTSYGLDEDGEMHLPLWNECVWGHLLDTYRTLFVTDGLAADPRLRFVFVPGAFDWAEFDYDIVTAAVDAGDLDQESYLSWYSHAWTDLVTLFGENATKLVFTGEDYPWGPFGAADDLLARDTVNAGMGIRNGITELFDFHLSEAPAFGAHIEENGHVTVDETLPIHSGRFVVAAENECFDACGYETDDVAYAVRQANLKALQLRVNWLYVVPEDSYLREYPELWDWVRLSLGQTAETSPDAWAALRDAEDTFWEDVSPFAADSAWPTRPWVRNLERWLVQVDEEGSVAHRTDVDTHSGEVGEDNGTAYEGLSTGVSEGDTGFVFEVDPRFAAAAEDGSTGAAVVKVAFLDSGEGDFTVETAAGSSAAVARKDSGVWRTATIALPDGALAAEGGEPVRFRLALADDADDLVVRFVRVVR